MRVMLDTDSCIYLINRRAGMVPQAALHECGISAVVLGELEFGVLNSQRPDANRERLLNFLGTVSVHSLGEDEAMAYASIRRDIKNQLIGRNDLWIAAHALAQNVPLITNNMREFARVPGLTVNTWFSG